MITQIHILQSILLLSTLLSLTVGIVNLILWSQHHNAWLNDKTNNIRKPNDYNIIWLLLACLFISVFYFNTTL